MKIEILIKKENYNDLLSKLEETSKIDDVLKIKIDKENVLLYSTEGVQSVLALKSFQLKTKDYFIGYENEFTTDFVILSSPKLIKNLKVFTDNDVKFEIEGRLTEDDKSLEVRSCRFSLNRIRLQWTGGEQSKIRDINSEILSSRLDLRNKKWNFLCSNENFSTIKKLSTLNSSSNPDDRLITINVEDGDVIFSEKSKWDIEVDKISTKSAKITFNKKYLSYINIDTNFETIEFNVFETFLLIKNKESNLMLSFEQNFD